MDLETESSPGKSILGEIFQTLLISLIGFLVLYVFLIAPHRIKGDSMIPNFVDGELILTEKISYRFSEPKRGDVVVFKAPIDNNVDFIKRIIGLPGDDIRIDDGSIIINNQKLKEDYEPQATEGNVERTLGEDEYFVLGDNRRSSSDSRSFGTISKSRFKGRVWVVYWPIFKSSKERGIRLVPRTHYSISNSLNNLGGRFGIALGNNEHFRLYS